MTVPVAFYGFQKAPEPLVVTEEGGGWPGWLDGTAAPLIAKGFTDHHVHNPFALHADVPGRDPCELWHVDQFDLSCWKRLSWLADRDGFSEVVGQIHAGGGTVRAYVGSPLNVARSPQDTYLPKCAPGWKTEAFFLRILRTFGLCWFGCRFCWARLVRFHIDPLIAAGVDAIGFDDSADFHPGDCMDRLVRSLLARGFEVMIEPWPKRLSDDSPLARPYPPVNWIIREEFYEIIQLRPTAGENWAPLESVVGKIYRIVPSHSSPAGEEEIARINELRRDHGLPEFEGPKPSQQIVDAVWADGHIPMVRAAQLESGEVE